MFGFFDNLPQGFAGDGGSGPPAPGYPFYVSTQKVNVILRKTATAEHVSAMKVNVILKPA